MQARRLAAATALIVTIGPAAMTAEENSRNHPTVQFAVGSHVTGGGNSQSLSFGVPAGPYLNFLVSAERSHIPTEINRYEHGYGATRGGTLKFVSAEARVSPRPFARLSPYALAALGRGASRPNVNELFRDRVTNEATLLFLGGGVRVPLTGHVSAFADARFVMQGERGEVGVILPIRGGLAWKF